MKPKRDWTDIRLKRKRRSMVCKKGHDLTVTGADDATKRCSECRRQRVRDRRRSDPDVRKRDVIQHKEFRRKNPEYISYSSAKARCQNKNDEHYPGYGGRGIEFRFKSYKEFLECLGRKPSPEHSVDRLNNNGHYEPENVRWATRSQQQKNRPRVRIRLILGFRQSLPPEVSYL
jgi:hypothetical protein